METGVDWTIEELWEELDTTGDEAEPQEASTQLVIVAVVVVSVELPSDAAVVISNEVTGAGVVDDTAGTATLLKSGQQR